MAEFTGTTTVSADPDASFAYLADVGNLPRYFSRMTSARPGEGDEVHTTAELPDGRETEGTAWFRAEAGAHRIEWGSEGPNDYRGHVEVRPSGEGSEIEVRLHTTRVGEGSDEVRDGIEDTLGHIRQQLG